MIKRNIRANKEEIIKLNGTINILGLDNISLELKNRIERELARSRDIISEINSDLNNHFKNITETGFYKRPGYWEVFVVKKDEAQVKSKELK